ncbi:MAG: hypothetical protein QM655_02480 [Nocardioidaceae bacterium]
MRVRAALALGALVLLAACNGDPGPTPPPITPSTTIPTVGTSPTATTDSSTDAEAIYGVVSRYFAALNAAALDGRTDDLEAFHGPGCGGCQTIASNIRRTYAAGGHIEGGQIKVKKIDQIIDLGNGRWSFRVRTHTSTERYFETSAAPVREHPAANIDFQIRVVRDGADTSITKLEILS